MPPKKTTPPKPPSVVYGSFDVDSSSHINVELPWRPQTVDVRFEDDPTTDLPSCDLNVGDELDFVVRKEGRTKWALRIKWSVKGTRTVTWKASRQS